MRLTYLQTFVSVVAFSLLGCTDDAPSSAGPGGSSTGTGGAGTGGGTSSGSGGSGTSGGSTGTGGATSGAGGSTGGASTGGTGSGGTSSTPCTNVRPTGTEWDEATCDQWATETEECGNAWMIDNNYCNESCGRCTGGSGGSGGSGSGGSSSGGSGGSGSVDCSGTPLTGGTPHCSSNDQGTVGNYTWTIWSSGSGGCITPYNDGAAFKATWNNSGDFLARIGRQFNETQTHTQLGTMAADYAYTKSGDAGGFSYIGIYGWSVNPLVEYYIVDDWFGNGPPTGGGQLEGSFTVDDGEYKIYTNTRVNQPSIKGTATFEQYFSVRQTPRQCGHISISAHFNEWAKLGMNLGNMYEAKILVEAGGGVGSVDFSSASLTVQ